jgi:hypothetical protein
VRGLQAEELLRRPVLVRGIRLGRIADVLFDPDGARVVGFDVLCGDEVHRFLPLPAAALVDGGLEVDSSLTLLDEETLAFYRGRGLALSAAEELRDAVVVANGGVEPGADDGNGAGRW